MNLFALWGKYINTIPNSERCKVHEHKILQKFNKQALQEGKNV